jgi:hypothetical protein
MALASPECVFELKSLIQSVERLRARVAFLEAKANITNDTARARLEWQRQCENFRSELEELKRQFGHFVENEPAALSSPLHAFRDLQRGIMHLTVSAADILDR